jgi:hypothetical protein
MHRSCLLLSNYSTPVPHLKYGYVRPFCSLPNQNLIQSTELAGLATLFSHSIPLDFAFGFPVSTPTPINRRRNPHSIRRNRLGGKLFGRGTEAQRFVCLQNFHQHVGI